MLKGPSVIIMQPSLFPKKFRDTHSPLECTTFTWTTNSNTRKGRNISPHGKSIFSTQNQKHISSQVKRKNKIQRHEKRIQRQKKPTKALQNPNIASCVSPKFQRTMEANPPESKLAWSVNPFAMCTKPASFDKKQVSQTKGYMPDAGISKTD